MKARVLFILLMVFFLGIFSAQAKTVTLQKGWNASWVARQFTGDKDSFRYFVYRDHVTKKDLKLTNPETGELSQTQLKEFKKLAIGTYIEIPEKLISTKAYQVKGNTLVETCLEFGGNAKCILTLKEYNRIKNSRVKITREIRIPNTFVQIVKKPVAWAMDVKEINERASTQKEIFESVFKALLIDGGILLVVSLFFFLLRNRPLYSPTKYKLLSEVAEEFTAEFNRRRNSSPIFSGPNQLYTTSHYTSKAQPVAKIFIGDNYCERDFKRFLGFMENTNPEDNEIFLILRSIGHEATPIKWTLSKGEHWVRICFTFEKMKLGKGDWEWPNWVKKIRGTLRITY